jgi:hypothetical protein
LRQKLYLCMAGASTGRRIDDYVLGRHSYSSTHELFSLIVLCQ